MPTWPDEDETYQIRMSLPESDLAAYQDFKRQWDEGTLPDDHPVVARAAHWAKNLSARYGHPERAEDLQQETLLRLARAGAGDAGERRPRAALDAYIKAIVLRLIDDEWRRTGERHRGEFPADVKDEASPDLFEMVLHMEEDEFVGSLLVTGSELRRTVVEIILGAEKKVGHQRLAEVASQKLGHRVTRRQVEVVLEQLRNVLRRHSGARETTAGRSLTELRGLGKELWRGGDAQEYVNSERESWHR